MSDASINPTVRPRDARRLSWPLAGRISMAVFAFWAIVAILGPWLLPAGLVDAQGNVFEGMSKVHPLGTDYLGRDMLVRVIEGASYTLGVALASTLLACGTGLALGLLAAVSGGWADMALARAMDIVISIPSKMLALVVVAAFGSSIPLLILTCAVVYTPGAFRLARSLAVNIGAMDFVIVSRLRGEQTAYVMFQEVLPGMTGPMLADMGLRFIYVVLLMASLGFLGLGIQPPDADWGSLVRENIGALAAGGVSVIAPAIAIASLTIAVNVVVDNLPSRKDSAGESI